MDARGSTIGSIARMAASVLVVGAIYLALGETFLEETPKPRDSAVPVSVTVSDPDTDPWIIEERARLERERLEQQKEREKLEAQKKALEDEKKVLEQKMQRLEDVSKDSLDRNEEITKHLEEQVAKTKEENEKQKKLLDRREEELKRRGEEVAAERAEVEKRQKELEDLARTLVEQQQKMAERNAEVENREKEVTEREKAAQEMAKLLLDKQENIETKQKALEESQRALSEAQERHDRELERVKDEWKRVDDQKKALEARLASAETTAADLAKAREEWNRLEAERKKLEEQRASLQSERDSLAEAKEVRANVERFKKQFDRVAYERGLANLKSTVTRQGLKDGFVPFDFKFYSEKDLSDHLQYFGIVDLYWNKSARRYLLMENYNRGNFSRQGSIDDANFQSWFVNNFNYSIKRVHHFYRRFLAMAEKRIGQGVEARGLVPVSMSFELLYHKKKMLETYNIPEKDLAYILVAPWLDPGGGRWMFKIIEARKTDGTVIKVGNYHFQ